MFFKSKRALEEEISRRVCEIKEHEYTDRRLADLEEQVRTLRWKVERLEGVTYGPNDRTPTPVNTGSLG